MTRPMAETNKWKLIHSYRNLVERGDAPAIRCPNCTNNLISVIDPDVDEPVPALWCPFCDKTVKPGVGLWDQISAAVRDADDNL